VGRGGGGHVHQRVDVAAAKFGVDGAGAAVGHVDHAGVGEPVEQRARHVRAGADA
jgi:hypothetical protein